MDLSEIIDKHLGRESNPEDVGQFALDMYNEVKRLKDRAQKAEDKEAEHVDKKLSKAKADLKKTKEDLKNLEDRYANLFEIQKQSLEKARVTYEYLIDESASLKQTMEHIKALSRSVLEGILQRPDSFLQIYGVELYHEAKKVHQSLGGDAAKLPPPKPVARP